MVNWDLVNDSVALVISALALIISFVSLYLSGLRGPSIKSIEPEESKRTVMIDNSHHPNIYGLPFALVISVVNSGGRAGIVRNPNVSITPVDSLKQEPLRIVIQDTSIEPSASASEQSSGIHSSLTYSIPPYSVNVITLRCHLALMEYERDPPIHSFTKGCDLKQVHLAHFNSNRERMRMLISKLQLTNTLGQIKVTIDCTEKTFPVLGPMKYKSKDFLINTPIAYESSLVKQLNENYEKLKFDNDYPVHIYLKLIDYLKQQSEPIIQMLEKLNVTSVGSYPTDNTDEQLILARRILSIKDETFGQLLNELDKYSQGYKNICRILQNRAHDAKLNEKDQLKIIILKEALKRTLDYSLNLRAVILKEFH